MFACIDFGLTKSIRIFIYNDPFQGYENGIADITKCCDTVEELE